MRSNKWSYCLWGLLMLVACQKESAPDCLKSTGPETEELRAAPPFQRIDLDDNIDLEISRDSVFSIRVKGGKNLLGKIETSVNEGVLRIRNHNRCNFVRSYKRRLTVQVSTPTLDKISYYGSGTIRSAGTLDFPVLTLEGKNSGSELFLSLDCDSLYALIHTGVSNLYLSGKSDYVYLYSIGSSIFYAGDLEGGYVHASNGSTGNFHVNAREFLHAEIRSRSNILYRGNPQISLRTEGTGKLLRYD